MTATEPKPDARSDFSHGLDLHEHIAPLHIQIYRGINRIYLINMEEALEIYLLSYFRLQHINSLPHRYETINEHLFNKGFLATRKIL